MTETYGPFSSGIGYTFSEDQWSSLVGAGVPDGVIDHASSLIALNKLAVTDNVGIMGVQVATGRAAVRGHWYQNDAVKNVVLAASDPTNPRIDWVVLELDRSADTVLLTSVAGTPNAVPTAPPLVRTSTKWQIPLAQVLVSAGVSTIGSGKATDARLWAKAVSASYVNGVGSQTVGTSYTDMDADGVGTVLMKVTKYTDGGYVEIAYSGTHSHADLNGATRVAVSVDGGSDIQGAEVTGGAATGTIPVSFIYGIEGLAAGLHTFQMRFRSVAGGNTTVGANRRMSVKEFR